MTSSITVKNSQLGDLTIEAGMIMNFPEGLIGFEHFRRFAIIDLVDYEPFQWLLSIDDPEITFPIISPLLVVDTYDPVISKAETYNLGEFQSEDLLLYAVVTIRPEINKVTANLKGPIIINQKNMMGQQIVLTDERFSTDQLFMSFEETRDG